MAMGQTEHIPFLPDLPLPRIYSVLHSHSDTCKQNNMYHAYINKYSLGYKYQKFNSSYYNHTEISHEISYAHQG